MPIVTMHVPIQVPDFPEIDFPDEDGIPLESDWHRLAMNVLIESVRYHLRARQDFYAGGNMFIYFCEEHAKKQDFRGPDFFFVWGAEREPLRRYWIVWKEGGRYPNVIVELASPTTAKEDRTTKKDIYERVFRTPEYFIYDPDTQKLEGWRLAPGNGGYEPIEPDAQGRLYSVQLGYWLGTWKGECWQTQDIWLRFFTPDGALVPLPEEGERAIAEAERRRAEAAEAELARLRARLGEGGNGSGADE